MVVRKSSSQLTTTTTSSSASSSNRLGAASTEGWDADDEDAMSTDDHPSPPLGVTIPSVGPCCPRRPTLREILANTSPAPWTLTAFMAYLSTNLCLETLEFTMDAGRYKKHYAKMMDRALPDGLPAPQDREYVQALWHRLVEAYIQPDGSREVNLPSDVRDPILQHPETLLPPAPETLDTAVAKVYELMEDSVLVPFLNSAYPQTALPIVSTYPSAPSDDGVSVASSGTHATSTTQASTHANYSRRMRSSEPPQSVGEAHTHPHILPHLTSGFRKSAPSSVNPTPIPSGRARFNARQTSSTSSPGAPLARSSIAETGSEGSLSNTLSANGVERMPGMMDDSGSANSPTYESPSTPPTSPPVSDGSSPKRDSGMWKRLGRLGGMKGSRKKSQGALRGG